MNKLIRVDFQQSTSESISELTPVDSLKMSLSALDVQIEIMRTETKEFRANIKSMATSVQDLGKVIADYDAALAAIKLKPLHRKSVRLARIMGDYLQENT
ncbi:MAG: hypothetical protein HON65_06630 [Rhodospirillales bacterium]|jgi:hypothetical protein|nr:hypothetical protein [Rhodospirillales bacterium]